MNDIKAIKVLEELINAGRFSKIPSHLLPDNFYSALSHAIAAMKSKSDAEVVCEYIKENSMSNLHWNLFMDKWVISHTNFAAPTLSDLAKKIGEMK